LLLRSRRPALEYLLRGGDRSLFEDGNPGLKPGYLLIGSREGGCKEVDAPV